MRTSKNPLAVQSQNWIFSSLIILLDRVEYDDITVGMLCKKAGVDRRTFYRYFDNKQDVLRSYTDKLFREYIERAAKLRSAESKEYLRLFFEFLGVEHRDFLRALRRSKLFHTVFAENGRYLTEINGLMDEMMGRAPSSYGAAYRAGGLINVLYSWAKGGFAEPPGEMADIISEVLK